MSILGIVPGSAAAGAWQTGFRQLSESNSAWSLSRSLNLYLNQSAPQPANNPAQPADHTATSSKSAPPLVSASMDPVQADLAALQAALETGNMPGAQAAFEKLLSDIADTHAHSPLTASTVSLVG